MNDQENKYTNCNAQSPNISMSQDVKKAPKGKKSINEKLYKYKNTASPDASDPPVPNQAFTEM